MLFDSLNKLTETAEAFLAGVRERIAESAQFQFGRSPGPFLPSDQALRLKDRLANAGQFNRELLARTPANPLVRCDLSGGLLGWLRGRRIRLVAAVAIDLAEVVRRASDESAAGDPWPALSAEAIAEAMRDVGRSRRRTFVGLCSPGGFSPEAVALARRQAAALSARGGGLVLIQPRPDGGWKLIDPTAAGGAAPAAGPATAAAWHFLFDPEPTPDKIERVRSAVAAASVDLAEGGLADRDLAERLDLPLALVREVFAAEAQRRAGLRIRELDGVQVLLAPPGFYEPSNESHRSTSMLDKLRQLLGIRGQEQKKIEVLADKRALLSKRRDGLYRQIDELAAREGELKSAGVASDSQAVRRRIASELGQVRRRIEQGNTVASLLNRQIDVLSTHIHHLTLVTQGEQVALPDAEELTRDAVRAEELIERVKADAELVESLAESAGVSLSTRQEDDILAEFAEAREQRKAEEKTAPQKAPPSAAAEAPPPIAELDPPPGREAMPE